MRSALNTVLSEYFVPMLLFIILGCVAAAFFKNSDNITDANGDGKRWGALLNVAKDSGYFVIIPLVITAILKAVQTFSVKL